MKPTKFIFITGGVLSSLGKGLAAASIAALLEARGLSVTNQKLDPYINVDPGTMSPYQHGEVFVTDDGAEADLDLGHYERFTRTRMKRTNNLTTGQIYFPSSSKETPGRISRENGAGNPPYYRRDQGFIRENAQGFDCAIVEIGGTVGDIEGLPFLEAVRQFRNEIGRQNGIFIHLTWVPFIKTAGEVKTKPTQHSVKALREIGIQPDILLCRTEDFLTDDIRAKIALFCNVEVASVFTAKDVNCIYEVPLVYHRQGVDEKIVDLLNIWTGKPQLGGLGRSGQEITTTHSHEVSIAVVGKYVNLTDSYKSLNEALVHGGIANDCHVNLKFVDSEKIEKDGLDHQLEGADGILIPGGFGTRGTEGMIQCVRYARTRNVPFFGICLGMQMAVVEFARHACGLTGANSAEFDGETPYPVIDLLPEQKNVTDKGGSMRLGSYPCVLEEDSIGLCSL